MTDDDKWHTLAYDIAAATPDVEGERTPGPSLRRDPAVPIRGRPPARGRGLRRGLCRPPPAAGEHPRPQGAQADLLRAAGQAPRRRSHPGCPGSCQHRAGHRRARVRRRRARPGHGPGRGPEPRRLARDPRPPPHRPGSRAGPLPDRRRRLRAEAAEHPDAVGARRPGATGGRLRAGQGAGAGERRPHPARHRHGYAGLHGPRAVPRRRHGGPAGRHLLPGRRALRAGDGPAGLPVEPAPGAVSQGPESGLPPGGRAGTPASDRHGDGHRARPGPQSGHPDPRRGGAAGPVGGRRSPGGPACRRAHDRVRCARGPRRSRSGAAPGDRTRARSRCGSRAPREAARWPRGRWRRLPRAPRRPPPIGI